MITVSIDYKESLSPQRLFSDFSQNTTSFTQIKTALHGYNASLNDKLEAQGISGSALLPVKHDSKTPQKNTLRLTHQNPRRGNTIF